MQHTATLQNYITNVIRGNMLTPENKYEESPERSHDKTRNETINVAETMSNPNLMGRS